MIPNSPCVGRIERDVGGLSVPLSKLVAHRPPAGRLGRSKGDSPDTGGSAPGVVCRRMHISIPGNWASNNPVFAISHGSCTAAPSTPSQRSMRSRHAVVPSRFPVQVRRVTQRPPPSEPLPSVRVIQRRVRRRNFALWSGSPGLQRRVGTPSRVGCTARFRIPYGCGPFPCSLPPNPACPLSRHRALQRFMPRARPGWRGSSHGTARRR